MAVLIGLVKTKKRTFSTVSKPFLKNYLLLLNLVKTEENNMEISIQSAIQEMLFDNKARGLSKNTIIFREKNTKDFLCFFVPKLYFKH